MCSTLTAAPSPILSTQKMCRLLSTGREQDAGDQAYKNISQMEEITMEIINVQKFAATRTFLRRVMDATMEADALSHRLEYYTKLAKAAATCEEEVYSVHNASIKARELEKELAYAKVEIIESQVAVSDFIGKLDNPMYQMVMMMRYVDLMSWEEIAANMNRPVHWVHRVHGWSLPLLDEIYNEEM